MVMGGAVCAHADEFTTLAAGDPIYAQLAQLTQLKVGRGALTPARNVTSLTRFEAALSTARSYFLLLDAEKAGKPSPYSREGAKAMRDLAASLRPELLKLDVDPDAVVALADKVAHGPLTAGVPVARTEGTDDFAPLRGGARSVSAAGVTLPAVAMRTVGTRTAPAGTPLPGAALLTRGGLAGPLPASGRASLSGAEIPLSQRLRVGTALLAMQRDSTDIFGDGTGGRGGVASPRPVGTAATITYDFNSYLRVRAGGSRRTLGAESVGASSALAAPIFSGATRASAAGGGVDLSLGSVRVSTDVERLVSDHGTLGTRVGGGVGLNAWQNRLSLSANLSRLVPEDSAVLSSTAAELNVGVDVTRRLSLNLLYQGLFTDQTVNNASRVAGGITLNF